MISILQKGYQQIRKKYKYNSTKIKQFMKAIKESALTKKEELFIGFPYFLDIFILIYY